MEQQIPLKLALGLGGFGGSNVLQSCSNNGIFLEIVKVSFSGDRYKSAIKTINLVRPKSGYQYPDLGKMACIKIFLKKEKFFFIGLFFQDGRVELAAGNASSLLVITVS